MALTPSGSVLLIGRHLLVDGARDRAAVLADQHEHRAQHDLLAVSVAAPVRSSCPSSTSATSRTRTGVTACCHDDVAHVVHARHLSGRPDQVLLAAPLDVARAHVRVVALERFDHVLQAQASARLRGSGKARPVLLLEAADGVDLGDAGHVAELRLDDPVLDLAQVGGRVGGSAIRLLRTVRCLHGPEVDFAQAGGDRAHARRDACGQPVARFLQALVDQLSREVDVGAVLEDDGDLRQAIPRQRAGLFQPRQAGHHGLDGEGDPLLGLERRVAWRLGVDDRLHVGDVGHGIDRQRV